MPITTIQEAIDRGRVSTYLSVNDNALGQLFGSRLASPGSSISIALITDALNWGNIGGAQSEQNLREVSNYLVWLCGMYGQQAQAILEGSGGGSVIPPGSSGYIYYSLSIEITSGDNDSPTYQNDIMIGATQLNYMLVNNNAETVEAGDFTFNSATGEITRVNHFFTGDILVIPFNRLV